VEVFCLWVKTEAICLLIEDELEGRKLSEKENLVVKLGYAG